MCQSISGEIPLHRVCTPDMYEGAKVLLSHVPEQQVLVQDGHRRLPLHRASDEMALETIQLLLQYSPEQQVLCQDVYCLATPLESMLSRGYPPEEMLQPALALLCHDADVQLRRENVRELLQPLLTESEDWFLAFVDLIRREHLSEDIVDCICSGEIATKLRQEIGRQQKAKSAASALGKRDREEFGNSP